VESWLLEGEITVSNQAGNVTLSDKGQGTDIPSATDRLGPADTWSREKVAPCHCQGAAALKEAFPLQRPFLLVLE
jgi:hypothetical protein